MKAILIDDEQLALDFLEHQLEKVGGIDIVGKYNNLHFYDEQDRSSLNAIDVIFLDIHMPEVNGLELAERFLEINPALSIVFVTAYNEYAVQAFALNALDYLLKPVQVNRLQDTVTRVKNIKQVSSEKVQVNGPSLNIKVCNELTIQTPQNTYETLKWRTSRAQELFLYLLQYSDRTIQKSELVELLWPDFDEKRAFPQLYTAIYHIRKILHPFDEYIGIKNNNGGYRLRTNNISLDVVVWESRIKADFPITIENLQDYEKHMQLYTGAYLVEYDYEWTGGERYRLEELWIRTAYQMANVYAEDNQLEKAVEWYLKICAKRPEDEESQFALMKVYSELGLGMLVSHQYKQLKNVLEHLGLEISAHISDWYLRWQE